MVKVTELDLAFVKHYLRVEHTDDDQLIELMLVAAKSYIQSYLNKRFEEFDVIPDELTIPALALVAHWYENRQIQTDRSAYEVVHSFSAILDMHRMFYGGEVV